MAAWTLQRDISLKRCAGWTSHGTLVEFAQDEILLNGMRVGYVGHAPGDAINLINPRLDQPTIDAISAHIASVRGTVAHKVCIAPELVATEEGGGDD